jgi:hypothetical protein
MKQGTYYIPTATAVANKPDSRADFFSRHPSKPGWHIPKGETMLPRIRRQNNPARVFVGRAKEFGAAVAVEYKKEWNRLGPKGRTAVSVAFAVTIVLITWAHMKNQALNTQIRERMDRIEAGAPR